MTAAERYATGIDTSAGPNGCWLWTRSVNTTGYPHFTVNGRKTLVHRYAYEVANGAIPEGLVICHACDTPLCVNAAHLWAGTQRENLLDMVRKGRMNHQRKPQRTYCNNGHEYTEDNIYLFARPGNEPRRMCRECRAQARLRYRNRRIGG